jgi:hypothetical protein
MKRRHFLGTLSVGGAAAALGQSPHGPAAASSSPLVRTPLVLMAPRDDGIEAVWAVGRRSRGWLELARESGPTEIVRTDPFGFVPQNDRILRLRLAGLAPGTRYRVRAHTEAVDDRESSVGPWKTFRTLDAAAAGTRFVVWNDTHENADTLRALHAVTPAADFLVWNGDTCNDWKSEDLFVPVLLHPGGCDITEDRPLILSFGNHDVRGAHAFRMPELIATPHGRPFSAFRSGPVAAIVLHTGEDKPDDHPGFQGRVSFDALRAEQAAWLEETIRKPEFRDAPYRLVFCHIPLRWIDESPQDYANRGFDRHSGRSRAAWHDALVAWKAQVIVSGHTHRPEWLPPTDAFPYGQLIGGGPQQDRATWIEGKADAAALRLIQRNLDGTVLHTVDLKPVG